LCDDIDFQVIATLALERDLIEDSALVLFLQFQSLLIELINVEIPFEGDQGRIQGDLTRVALTDQTEGEEWNAEELSVRANILRHRDLGVNWHWLFGGLHEVFKTFWGLSDTLDGQVLHDQVAILEVGLSMLW